MKKGMGRLGSVLSARGLSVCDEGDYSVTVSGHEINIDYCCQ